MAPSSFREIGKEIGTSHTQAKRLLRRAEAGGLLTKANAVSLAYDRVLAPPTADGVVWIPRTECLWRKPVCWVRDEGHGVWLDRAVYGIRADADLWAVTFPEPGWAGQGDHLRLHEYAMALIRRRQQGDLQKGCWYLMELDDGVITARFQGLRGGELAIRLKPTDQGPTYIKPGRVRGISEIVMITTRPPSTTPTAWYG